MLVWKTQSRHPSSDVKTRSTRCSWSKTKSAPTTVLCMSSCVVNPNAEGTWGQEAKVAVALDTRPLRQHLPCLAHLDTVSLAGCSQSLGIMLICWCVIHPLIAQTFNRLLLRFTFELLDEVVDASLFAQVCKVSNITCTLLIAACVASETTCSRLAA